MGGRCPRAAGLGPLPQRSDVDVAGAHEDCPFEPMLTSRPRVRFLGCPLDLITRTTLLNELCSAIERRDRKYVIQFLNANKIAAANADSDLRAVLHRADFVLADGQPLLPMARMLGVQVPERIDGIGLMESLLALSAQRGYRPYLLGARADVLATCVERIQARHPTIQLAGSRNGYFDALELPGIVREVNATRPDILFLGLGSPMKERLADEWRTVIDAPVIQGVGGSFDVLAGLVPRAPLWMQRSGLEWAFRVIQEPRRMFWRYLKTNSQCTWLFARALARRSIGVDPDPA